MAARSAYADLTDRPLFGETRSRDRVSYLIIAILTSVFVISTLVSSFLFPRGQAKHGIYIFLAICLLFLLASHLCLTFWYRSGELEPRFRNMLYFNTFVIVMLCICANLVIHGYA